MFHHYSLCSDRGRISANHRREEKLVNQSSTPVDQWVLLGIALSASEKVAWTILANNTLLLEHLDISEQYSHLELLDVSERYSPLRAFGYI